MTAEWERKENVIAERFKKEEIPGFLTKEFVAKENEFVVVERGREIYRELGPGELSISGFASDLTCILLVDKSEKKLESEIKNVWLEDDKKIDINFSLKFRIFHSDHFSKRLMGERKVFSIKDLQNEIFSNVFYKKILPELQKNKAEEFLNDNFRDEASGKVESEIKNKFKHWGLILSSMSIDFKVPESVKEEKKVSDEAAGKPEMEP